MGSRSEAVKQWKKSENKWMKGLKSPKNQNKILYSTAKKTGSSREIRIINNIKAKASKKRHNDSIDYSSNESDPDSSLSSNSD